MIHGKFIFILNSNGDCLVTPDFNGDMYPKGRYGSEAIELLKRCKSEDDFEKVALRFVKKFNLDENYSDEELDDGEFLKLNNIIKTSFTFDKESHGLKDYIKNWFADFIYVLNISGSNVETKICDEECNDINRAFKDKTLIVLKFGELFLDIPCIDETLADYESKVHEDICEMTNSKARRILLEFNDWRRGIGPYEFKTDPAENTEFPYSPAEIGKAIDVAIGALGPNSLGPNYSN